MKVNSKELLEMIEKRNIKNKTFFKDRFGQTYKYFIDEYDLINIIRIKDNADMTMINFINNEFEILV